MPLEPPESSSALVRRPQAPLSPNAPKPASGLELLPRLDLEDYVPSVRPWLRISSWAVLVSAGLGLLFISICPYRVVVRSQGFVRPAGEQVLVNAPFSGRVASIDVTTNQAVALGQAIVSLDRSRLRGEVQQAGSSRRALDDQMHALRRQAQADYAKAELEVEKSRSSFSLAESEVDRYQELVSQGAASASLFQAKQAALAEASATLRQAIENLDAVRFQGRSREAELRKEMAAIEKSSQEGARNLVRAIVRSPVKGILFQLKVQNPEQTIAEGQPLAVITPSSAETLVKVEVRSEDVETVQAGQAAELRVAGCPYPDFGTLPARVLSVSPDALPQPGGGEGTEGNQRASNLYEVTLKPKRTVLRSSGRPCSLKLGMQVQADIITREETILRFVLRKTRLLIGQ